MGNIDDRQSHSPVDPHFRYFGPRTDYERSPEKADADRRAMTLGEKNAIRKRQGLPPLAE